MIPTYPKKSIDNVINLVPLIILLMLIPVFDRVYRALGILNPKP